MSITIIPLQFELVPKPTREAFNEELSLNNDNHKQLVSITIIPLQFELVPKPTREAFNEELSLNKDHHNHQKQLVSKITIILHDLNFVV